MQLEARKYLRDIHQAAELLALFTDKKAFADFEADPLLRAAVERQFEIIGEAMSQLARIAPEVVSHISEYRRVIAFRNVLIHGYAEVDNRLVWDIVETKVATLRREIGLLLEER